MTCGFSYWDKMSILQITQCVVAVIRSYSQTHSSSLFRLHLVPTLPQIDVPATWKKMVFNAKTWSISLSWHREVSADRFLMKLLVLVLILCFAKIQWLKFLKINWWKIFAVTSTITKYLKSLKSAKKVSNFSLNLNKICHWLDTKHIKPLTIYCASQAIKKRVEDLKLIVPSLW